MNNFAWAVLAAAACTLVLVLLLHGLGKLGRAGKQVSEWLIRAPGLDVVVASLTWVQWVVAGVVLGWSGAAGALVGQLVALGVWVVSHEFVHREAARGPRIVKVVNRTVGRWRNHAALWVTAVTYPVFWLIRFAQVFAYPMLTLLIGLPGYRQGEWVNVSRQKFQGLIGHDLIWCLYCDWMTGVYSLGAEMLRNVESFWCPIRFYDGKKCENCKIDFPDIEGGWVRPEGTMAEVAAKMEEMYGGDQRGWFGHPQRSRKPATVRLTVGETDPAAPTG